MTWPFGSRSTVEETLEDGRRRRAAVGSTGSVSAQQAMRLSVLWACRRLRADLVSTMPLDVYRRIRIGESLVQVEVPKPRVMMRPDGKRMLWSEFVYSTQMDLDGYGNTMGVIEEVDANNLPAVIRLASAATAVVREDKTTRELTYRLGGKEYPEAQVWHEKQFTVPGVPVGLSPIGYAALTLNTALTATEFATSWFSNGARPAAHLKNEAKVLNKPEARRVKQQFIDETADGDVFVSGADWSFNMISGKASEAMFLEQLEASNLDVCRFMGVPGDMVDVATKGSSITYANITERNLQLLIMHLNPAIRRREEAWSLGLLPQPRYAKLNRGVILEMDLKSRNEAIKIAIDGRWMTPDEARGLDDRAPLTEDQEAQFGRLFGQKGPTPAQPVATAQRADALELHASFPLSVPVTVNPPTAETPDIHVHAGDIHLPQGPAPVVEVSNHVEAAVPVVEVHNRVDVPVGPAPVVEVPVTVQPADVQVELNGPTRTHVRYDKAGELIVGTDYEYES